MATLTINPGNIFHVIVRARTFDVKADVIDPLPEPGYERNVPVRPLEPDERDEDRTMSVEKDEKR